MKIVVDDKIPYIREALAEIADDVVYLQGSKICADDVKDADALIVRTRTRCDAALLDKSSVKFIATATIGFDHIDTAYLEQKGIVWTNCPGCNASSVAQYIESCLVLLSRKKGVSLDTLTLGVVGCGHVGSKVKAMAEERGMKVLVCDPPLASLQQEGDFMSLDTLDREADIITFHVPMQKDGPYKTYHMADEQFFRSLSNRHPVIINSSRGGVVDNKALLSALEEGLVSEAIIDTWENEPSLLQPLLDKVFIGTPHIAGYSADGKTNADNMVIEALCQFFGKEKPSAILPPEAEIEGPLSEDKDERVLQYYNAMDDSMRLKACPQDFEKLRGDYPVRREETIR